MSEQEEAEAAAVSERSAADTCLAQLQSKEREIAALRKELQALKRQAAAAKLVCHLDAVLRKFHFASVQQPHLLLDA